ncbi:MAG: divergent polysaccharide deacetylase family protein [Nitrospirae bacterium]|nr:divergent polysaccharide deacetylase family protein [Nitrospirota bacterium]
MKKNRRILIIVSVSIAVIIVIFSTLPKSPPKPPPALTPEKYEPTQPEIPVPHVEPKKVDKKYRGRVAIVIDDVGNDKKIFRKFTELGIPVTFSILPGERYSKYIANEAWQLKYEVMLHLPMEPHGSWSNPGSHAILAAMSDDQMLRQLSEDLDAVPHAAGVNNHMGSLLTENDSAMRVILEEIYKRGLFFIDSRTSSQTVAYNVAKSIGVKSGDRDVFLDNKPDIEYIKGQIDTAIRIAKKRGEATVIGHAKLLTAEAILEKLPDFEKERIELVTISRVLD